MIDFNYSYYLQFFICRPYFLFTGQLFYLQVKNYFIYRVFLKILFTGKFLFYLQVNKKFFEIGYFFILLDDKFLFAGLKYLNENF